MVLPLILLSGVSVSFFNLYFESFENYHDQNIGSDVRIWIYSNQTNYYSLNSSLHDELKGTPYKGFVAQTSLNIEDRKVNLTVSNPNFNITKYYNYSITLNGLNFSGRDIKNFFLNKSINLVSGNFPKNENETFVPIIIQQAFNLTLNSTINFYSQNATDFNATVVGFYESKVPRDHKYYLYKDFVFIFNDGQVNRKFPNFTLTDYQIYLDHKQMDVFNSNAFITEISEIESKIREIFSNNDSQVDIFSSKSQFYVGNFEYFEYLSQVYSNFFYLVGPIFVLLLIFSYLFSKYNARAERDTSHKIMVFKSPKYIKIQLFFDLLLNNLLSYLISIPFGIFLYFTIGTIFNQPSASNLEIFLPLPFLLFTLFFNLIYIFITYFFSSREIPAELDLTTKKHSDVETPLSSKIIKKIAIIVLIVISLLPIFVIILYYTEVFFYNPIINGIYYFLKGNFEFFQPFYIIIIIAAVLVLLPGIILRFLSLINRLAFWKLKSEKVKLLKSFFLHQKKSIIVFIAIISLGIGFINFYQIDRINRFKQQELEVYLKVGSDFKLYEPYLYGNYTEVNMTRYFDDSQYCTIQSVVLQTVNHSIIYPELFAAITMNPYKYHSTLNNSSKSVLDETFVFRIEDLNPDEILVPTYLQIRYNLKENDTLVFQPQNTTAFRNSSGVEFLNEYYHNFKIKGFFNFFPGFDQDLVLFNTVYWYSDGAPLITSPQFNYTLVFPETEVRRISLIKDKQDTKGVVENLRKEVNGISTSLSEELRSNSMSYITTMNNTISTVFGIFVVIFLFMNVLFIARFVRENDQTWNLLQLWGIPETRVKRMIFWSLVGIFLISFLLGLLGVLGAFLILVANNMEFTSHLYLYPIQFHFDPTGILFNLFYLLGSIIMAWLFTTMVINVRLNYLKIKNYYIE